MVLRYAMYASNDPDNIKSTAVCLFISFFMALSFKVVTTDKTNLVPKIQTNDNQTLKKVKSSKLFFQITIKCFFHLFQCTITQHKIGKIVMLNANNISAQCVSINDV